MALIISYIVNQLDIATTLATFLWYLYSFPGQMFYVTSWLPYYMQPPPI